MKKQIIISIIIVALALLSARFIFYKNKDARTDEKVINPLLVNTMSVNSQLKQFEYILEGRVVPHKQNILTSEISGKVVNISDNFKSGAYVKKGEILVEIDTFQLQLDLEKANAFRNKMLAQLKSEKILANVAAKEWEWRKNKNIGQLAKETALRKPQLNAAQASLKMAQLDIRKINNHINKAIIKAPFSGVIDKKNIEGDQYITMGSPLGSLISIDKAEIKIAISEDNLKKIQLPSLQSRTTHSVLVYDFENSSEYRVGTLVRTDAVLDVATNFFYGYATINDPFSLKSSKPALRIGSFVKVKIKGKNQSRLFKLPVNILNGGRTVWLVDQDSRLKQKKINIVEYDTDHVFVTGLDDGDEVCLTLLPNFLPGQLIQRNNK